MHVVHVYDGHEKVYGGRGSVPTVVWKIARETAAAGHRVTVIERQWEDLEPRTTHDGVAFERLALSTGSTQPWEDVPYEMVGSPSGVLRLIGDRANFAVASLRRLRQLDTDLLHVHLPFAANVMMTVAPWLRSQTVYTAHLGELRMNALSGTQQGQETDVVQDGQEPAPSAGVPSNGDSGLDVPGLLKAVSPDVFLSKRVAKTTVLNENIETVFTEQGVPKNTLSVVPNGVDYQRFSNVSPERLAAVRESYDIDSGPLLLFVGTVMPRKGVDDLVRAVGQLAEDPEVENLHVIIAGEDDLDGAYTTKVRDLAERLGVSRKLTFSGFVPDEELPALYTLADVFVLPSREEGFGMTVLEAMAAGTPVVATDVGGIPRLITDGEQGYLIEPNDPSGIVMYVKRLLAADGGNEGFKKRTQEQAREYAWSSIASQFHSIYQTVLESEAD